MNIYPTLGLLGLSGGELILMLITLLVVTLFLVIASFGAIYAWCNKRANHNPSISSLENANLPRI